VRPLSALSPRLPRALAALALAALATACMGGGPDPSTPEGRACAEVNTPDPALARPMDPTGVDQWLFDEAIRRAVNTRRCDRGLPPLLADPALARAATYHSGDMVARGFFEHTSPVPGRTSLRDRYREVGANYPRAAENIAEVSLFDFGGQHFYVRDAATCQFSFSPNGPVIPARTYANAAESLVELWMTSSGHKRNLMDKELTHHGAGAALRPNPETCGDLLVAQDFGG